MRNYVEGGSQDSLSTYYGYSRNGIQDKIDSADKNALLNSNIDELVEFCVQDFVLPLVEIDSSKKPIVEDETKVGRRQMALKIKLPLIQEEGIDTVIGHTSSTQIIGVQYAFENGFLISYVICSESNTIGAVQNQIERLETVLKYKNQQIPGENANLRDYTKRYLTQIIQRLQQNKKGLDELESLQIELVKKGEGNIIPDLKVKEKIRVLMPESKKRIEPELQQDTVNKIVDVIRNHCRQFEITPKGFSKLNEEELRDVILANLNSHFEPLATGETFVKLGKTDLHLKLNIEGGILSGECKFWNGYKAYQEAINQHFKYLTWIQDFAIQITFSKNKDFSNIIEESIKASTEYSTYIKDSLRRISDQYFVTENTFPEDSKKKIEIHHILVNMYTD